MADSYTDTTFINHPFRIHLLMSEDIPTARELSELMRHDLALQNRLYDLAEQRNLDGITQEVSRALGKQVADGPGVLNIAYIFLTPSSAYDALGE